MRSLFLKFYFLFLAFSTDIAHAWGERGHDLVTRVAVQHLRLLTNDNPKLVRPFVLRDHMLSHFSNVPDIVWRAPYQSKRVLELNPPTHYINLEKVYQDIQRWGDLPSEFGQFTQAARAKGFEPSEVGTAPWRVMQLYQELVIAMRAVTELDEPNQLEQRVNRVLLLAGVMSHFVGDLANPHHTTANYDGQLTGQRGLHAYFESETVAEQGFDLVQNISRQAKRNWLREYSNTERTEIKSDPLKLIWALVANSHTKLPELMKLDKRYSLLSESVGEKDRANRKSAKVVAKRFKSLTVKRLGAGAAALSQLWLLAWQEAGSPDMSEFFSYDYPVKPGFIDPDY